MDLHKESVDLGKLFLSLIILLVAVGLYVSIQYFATDEASEFLESVEESAASASAEKLRSIADLSASGDGVQASMLAGALYEAQDLEYMYVLVDNVLFIVSTVEYDVYGVDRRNTEFPCHDAAAYLNEKHSLDKAKLFIEYADGRYPYLVITTNALGGTSDG